MTDMEWFEAKSRPPKDALKAISGGRLKGMTDIKPQWRNKAMTELYGLCGFGWKYTIDKQWSETCSTGEVMCFVNISLFIMVDGAWSDAIPATGGSQIVELEKNYDYRNKQDTPDEPKKVQYANDEGYKMALTDALSVAMQRIGIAGAIYEGLWDGSKYKTVEQPIVAENLESILDKAVADGILTPDKADDTLKAYQSKKPSEQAAFVQAVKNKLEKTAYENLSRGQ
jgi:hypothetical protein